jgi:nitroimidazol reductase NimA-like FMN-containing flavoprotein (pyridoxamine 5'-phosphate oxidase superfamily)
MGRVAVVDQTRMTDHAGLTVLRFDECLRLLESQPVGRVAFTQDGGLEILPVNYCVLDTSIGFRTGAGSKWGAALQGKPVAFEVDEFDPARRTGWSVVVKGLAEPVEDEAVLDRLEAAGLISWAAATDRPWSAGPQWVLIRAEAISGRRTPDG